jgi:hypothetical protein
MRRFTVTFTREMDVSLLAPEDATEEEIQKIADGIDLDDWDPPEWEASVSGGRKVEVPDSECGLGAPNKYGHRAAVDGALAKIDVVLSDERDDLVCATDASWWVKSKAPAVVCPIEHGGKSWAVAGNIIVRADLLPAGFEQPWIAEPMDLAPFIRPQSRLANGTYNPAFVPVLALGVLCLDGGDAPVVMRDGEVIAVVPPYRGEDGVRVVDGKVSS